MPTEVEELLKLSSILIVGAGTFGCSTALHLARRGYKNVTCLDAYPVPSAMSAGNDINKIVGCFETNGDEPLSTRERMKQETIHLWKTDPVFNNFYHPVGMISAANLDEPLTDTKEYNEFRIMHGFKPFKYLSNPEDFRKVLPVLTGPLKGWRGYFYDEDEPKHGWVEARNSMVAAAKEAEHLGVKFISGDDGKVEKLVVEELTAQCIGVETTSHKKYSADRIVLSAGAGTDLLMDFKGQLEAKCFTLAHVFIEEEDRQKYKDLPLVFNAESGFFFEPDPEGLMKICNEFPGYTNFDKQTGKSTPLRREAIPKEAAAGIRKFLKDTMPELADKELLYPKICWCTDSPDRQLIIDTHPDYENVILATGDSGRSFNMLPIIGKYISDIITKGVKGLEAEDRRVWRWRPETSGDRDNKQSRWGGSGHVTDLGSIQDWE